MPTNRVSAELDDIANGIEKLGKRYPKHTKELRRMAAQLDLVSNQFERNGPGGRQAAEATPGLEEWGPEDTRQDAYEAEDYHKVPVGNDSLAKAIDKNPADILGDLDFAQHTSGRDKHRILVQAGKQGQQRQASWPFSDLTPIQFMRFAQQGRWSLVARAAQLAGGQVRQAGRREAVEMEVDLGDEGDDDQLSVANLPESGDEDVVKPVDVDEEGGTLQFFGTYPQKDNDDGPDSGHHRRNVEPPNREWRVGRRQQQAARSLLERVADRAVQPEVKQPDDLLADEPGDDVERDQSLGGLSGRYKGRKSGRASGQAEVRVYRPTHVPQELHPVWHRAAKTAAANGTLLTQRGKVDYYGVNRVYRAMLGRCRQAAAQVPAGQARRASAQESAQLVGRVPVYRPAHVPRELVAYWNGAASYLQKHKKLVTASGRVNYDAVNQQYIRLLDYVNRAAAQVEQAQ